MPAWNTWRRIVGPSGFDHDDGAALTAPRRDERGQLVGEPAAARGAMSVDHVAVQDHELGVVGGGVQVREQHAM